MRVRVLLLFLKPARLLQSLRYAAVYLSYGKDRMVIMGEANRRAVLLS